MSNESNIRDCRSSYHIGNRLPRNPFDPIPIIPHLEWCKGCQMDVDVQIEAGNADGIDVYRKRCKRCGNIMMHGIGRRHISGKNLKPLPAKALRFVQQKGKDRR